MTSNDDQSDGVCDAGHCSLREAISAANAQLGLDSIAFGIPSSGTRTISPRSALPQITDPVIIDGYSQPGARRTTSPVGTGFDAVLLIELEGGNVPGSEALRIVAGNSTVRGLVINRFGSGDYFSGAIVLTENGGNVIEGNFLGTDTAGTSALGNLGSAILISDSPNNTIGGTAVGTGNVVSGNSRNGVHITGARSIGNLVAGNLIGTDITGLAALGNGQDGIDVDWGAAQNTIGGSSVNARNVISGNGSHGVTLFADATENLIIGNYIGADITGAIALGNRGDGVSIQEASNNLVGQPLAEAANVISANGTGVHIEGERAFGNVVQGNLIGTDSTGTSALGSHLHGVSIHNASRNTIGGASPGAGNVIVNYKLAGVGIVGFLGRPRHPANSNAVQGNRILGDITGTRPIGDAIGVNLQDAIGTSIGGALPGAGNTIAFNPRGGVLIHSPFRKAYANAVLGNAVFSNGSLGIELGALFNGVTPNDARDRDKGPNQLQNFPVLSAVTSNGGTTTVSGRLESLPRNTFRIEFFASRELDGSQHGEGEVFLGSIDVRTDARGRALFSATLTGEVSPGGFVTATATDPKSNTSEFSRGICNCVNVAAVEVVLADRADHGSVQSGTRPRAARVAISVSEGEVVTRLLKFSGKTLNPDYGTAALAAVRVELQDAVDEPIEPSRRRGCCPGELAASRLVEWL